MKKVALVRFVLGHRALVVGLIAAATVVLGWQAAQVGFDNSIETYFQEDDIAEYRRFLDHFGTDEIIAIAFDSDVFTQSELELIDRISRELEELPHVRRVLSLTKAKVVFGDEETVYFDPLVEEIPSSPRSLAALRRRALADPFLPGTVVSHDLRSAAVVAEIDHLIGEFDYKVELIARIREIVRELERETGKRFRIGGTAVIDDVLLLYTQRDQATYVPLMVLIVIGLVFAMFRSLKMVLLPVTVVLVTIVWTYGFVALLGYRINIITTILTPLLMAVAIADSMHFIADYLHEAASGRHDKYEAIERSFINVWMPCLMTSVTTAVALLALLSADLVPIRELGLVAALGVLAAFAATVLLLPVLLSVVPFPEKRYRARLTGGWLAGLLRGLGDWRRPKALAVLAVSTILTVAALFSLPRLTIGTNSLDYLKPADPVRGETEWIDARVGGTSSLEFLVETGEEDAIKQPALLRRMGTFEEYLRTVEGVTGVYSVVGMVKALNRAFYGGDERFFRIPDSSEDVAQQFLLVEGSEDIDALLADGDATARIVARVEMARSQELSRQMPEIERRAAELFGDAATVTPTGMVHLMHRMEGYLLSSQVKSLSLAFVVISLLMLAMLRSVRLGLVALIPNLLPILFTLALMPWLGIPLDVGTVMIAVIALGLVVDDTIHLLVRFKSESERVPDMRRAMARALTAVGRPVVYTSVALSLGFLVLVFASFNSMIHFGVLSAIVIALALVFDLVVLPAVVGFLRLPAPRPGGREAGS
ncbi:MAG: efflux RND transporter permease subunit [Acidobacteriota bacterium]|nr:efflux RND transporter permease subunit [Acidobacteriota bacterium]